jgi:hypothetical protein
LSGTVSPARLRVVKTNSQLSLDHCEPSSLITFAVGKSLRDQQMSLQHVKNKTVKLGVAK